MGRKSHRLFLEERGVGSSIPDLQILDLQRLACLRKLHSNTCAFVSNTASPHWNTCEFITNTGVCTQMLECSHCDLRMHHE